MRPFQDLDLTPPVEQMDSGMNLLLEHHDFGATKAALFKPAAVAFVCVPSLSLVSRFLGDTSSKVEFFIFALVLALVFAFLNWLFEEDQQGRPRTTLILRHIGIGVGLYFICIHRSGPESLFFMHVFAIASAFFFSNALITHYIIRLKAAVPRCAEKLDFAYEVWRHRWQDRRWLRKNGFVIGLHLIGYYVHFQIVVANSTVRPLSAAFSSLLLTVLMMIAAIVLTLREFRPRGVPSLFPLQEAISYFLESINLAMNYDPTFRIPGRATIQLRLYRVFGNFPLTAMLFLVTTCHMASAYYYGFAMIDREHLEEVTVYDGIPFSNVHEAKLAEVIEAAAPNEYEKLSQNEKEQAVQVLRKQMTEKTFDIKVNTSTEAWLIALLPGLGSAPVYTILLYSSAFLGSVILSTIYALSLCFAMAGADIADLHSKVHGLLLNYASSQAGG